MDRKFTVYLSHSWRPRDVDLNLWVWDRLAERCNLLVDRPDSQDEHPPYYVTRLEEILRRSDIFVSILTFRPNSSSTSLRGDYALRCSPASLFEIRLAERARRPRLVLYERATGFRRPPDNWDGAKYIPFDRGAQSLPELLDVIKRDIANWLNWVEESKRPRFPEVQDRAVILLPKTVDSPMVDQLKGALQDAQFATVDRIEFVTQTDAELIERMLNAGLLVADVTSDGTRELYTIAHALFVPAIRLAPGKDVQLPWILNGHPGGYQQDIVFLSGEPTWAAEVTARAAAIFRVTQPLGFDEGCKYIRSRRYKGVFVFLSHNLRPGRRKLLDLLIQKLGNEQIDFFEYYRDNEAGIEWQPELNQALEKATLFTALLADGYEDSPVSIKEWAYASERHIPILPFLVDGRTTRTNLTRLHNQTLDSPEPTVNAEIVFDRIKRVVTPPISDT
jgi:hypothetical protein